MKKILISLLAAAALTACTHEKENTNVFSNFATLDVISSKGAVLSVQNPGDPTVYTLTASQDIQSTIFKAGTRVFISYTTASNTNTASESCTLQAMYTTEGAGEPVMPSTAEATKDWESIEIQLGQVSITGNYINIVGGAGFAYDNYECQLYVDQATINDAFPQLHLVLVNKGAAQEFYTVLGSWSFENLMNSGNCKGLILNANNPNGSGPIKIEF